MLIRADARDQSTVPSGPLRIAHVINESFGPESANGVQQAVYCLARAQAEMGEAVAVYSRDDSARYVLADRSRTIAAGGLAPSAGPYRSVRQRLMSCWFESALARDIEAWRPDIVHFHSVHIPRNVALGAYLDGRGIPYCVTVHGGLFREAQRRARLKKHLFTLAFERSYLNAARFVHAVSAHETEAIRRHGVERPIVVVPNGVPPDSLTPISRPDALYEARPRLRGQRIFMFIGRLDPWQKGLDVLLEAFAVAAVRQSALVLIGPDSRGSLRTLAALAERLGIGSRVVFMGPAYGMDRANLCAGAHVFVHPSRWEGLSLSVLAAAAAGKPCLITRAADPLGRLERAQAAVIVEPTVASIAAGLQRASTFSDDELELMGAHARQVGEAHVGWPAAARGLAQAYRRVLGTGGGLDPLSRIDDGENG